MPSRSRRLPESFMMPIGLLALSLAAFAIGTGEFVIAGILPDLSADFGVSIAATGLLVSVYAGAVAIGGPILAVFTAGLPRKPLIVFLLAVFCAGQAFCATAPTYSWLMAGRVFSACSHGLFFGTGSVAAMKLVPPQKRGMAMALFLGGITVANLLGMPAGTAIGYAFGWRWTFCAVGACGLAATWLVARLLPSGPVHREHATSLTKLRVPRLCRGGSNSLTFTGVRPTAVSFVAYRVDKDWIVLGSTQEGFQTPPGLLGTRGAADRIMYDTFEQYMWPGRLRKSAGSTNRVEARH